MYRFGIILCVFLGLAVMVYAAATHRNKSVSLVPPVTDLKKWTWRVSPQLQASIQPDNDAVRIDVTQIDENGAWRVGLLHVSEPLKPNQKYKLSFETKSTKAFAFWVGAYSAWVSGVESPYGGGHQIGLNAMVEAGPDWSPKEFTFTTKDTDGHMDQTPTFTLGGMTGTVWLRNVTLTEVD
jgi:hypothetical protein